MHNHWLSNKLRLCSPCISGQSDLQKEKRDVMLSGHCREAATVFMPPIPLHLNKVIDNAKAQRFDCWLGSATVTVVVCAPMKLPAAFGKAYRLDAISSPQAAMQQSICASVSAVPSAQGLACCLQPS